MFTYVNKHRNKHHVLTIIYTQKKFTHVNKYTKKYVPCANNYFYTELFTCANKQICPMCYNDLYTKLSTYVNKHRNKPSANTDYPLRQT